MFKVNAVATPRRQTKRQPLVIHSWVGNLGCIRFPQPVRRVAGIKRGDRLLVLRQDATTVVLEKAELLGFVDTVAVELEACACESPAGACLEATGDIVTVGWSYVQLSGALATELGFVPDAPLRMTAEPSTITVTLHTDLADLEGVDHPACPP